MSTEFDLDRPWRVDPRVSMRPEPFGALLYHFGTRRLSFLKNQRVLTVVRSLADHPSARSACAAAGVTAAELLNHSAEKAIADWLYQFGEERRARRIARAIVKARPIRSTLHLAGVVERAVPRTGPMHPATRTFQALRIAVNGEMEQLDALLRAAPGMMRPGGRVVIISFHSLEDRRVKESFRELARSGQATVLTKKPIVPSEQEVRKNPPSRSAKLRAVEIISATK